MQNLPTSTISNLDNIFITTPRSGTLKSAYGAFKNLQEDTGLITDFRTELIKFDVNHPLDIEVQPSYDGSVNLIINDDKNQPLLINSRFSVQEGGTYQITEHSGINDTNLYSKEQLSLDTRLYKTITKVPQLEFLGLANNGKFKCGTYHFYFKYSDVDDNETDFVLESSTVTCHIGNINDPKSIRMGMMDENSEKSIKFKLSNIDTQYDLLKIYYTRTTSDNSQQEITTAHFIDNKYVINGESIDITLTGFEKIQDISIDEINLLYEICSSVKTQAQCQNRLFFGNINKPNINYQELADLSLRIIPSIVYDTNIGNIDQNYVDSSRKFEYYNANNLYSYLGYWPEEYYRFGIVYILNDYSLSPVFNVRGLDLTDNAGAVKEFNIYDETSLTTKRLYIDYDSKGYITGRTNNFDNAKGVVKLPKKEVITNNGVVPIGIKFEFYGSDRKLEDLLSEQTKGFFIVRQKRIPTILAQGCAIGKTNNEYGNIPVLPINKSGVQKGIAESFVKYTNLTINKEDNPFLVKRWRWRYPVYYADGVTRVQMQLLDSNEAPTGAFIDIADNSKAERLALENFHPTRPLDPFNYKNYTPSGPRNDGDLVKSKYRTEDRVGNGLYGYWDFVGNDTEILNKLKDTFGANLRELGSNKLLIDNDKYKINAAIVPEVELREAMFNQIFTSSKFSITTAKEQAILDQPTYRVIDANNQQYNYYLIRNNTIATDITVRSALLTIVNDNIKLTTNGTDLFSARAGEAEQAWEVVDVKNNWNVVGINSADVKDDVNKTLTQSTSLVRGSFGTYVGIGDLTLTAGEIFNIRPGDFSETLEYKTNMFEARFSSFDPYFSVSDRIEWDNLNNYNVPSVAYIDVYRGDCYVGNFTHRMHRNFIDPELPTNDKIIDPYTWYKGFAVKMSAKTNDKAINEVLLNFKRNNQGKILEPSDAKYDKAGSTREALTGESGYAISGAHKINRADVNAVPLGHWFTFKVMSNVNVSMRDINLMEPAEQSIFGKPRGFYPLYPMSTKATYKLPESNILNAAANITLSKRFNFLIPDIPFYKNKFDTRINYSDIHITDAFRNGYRVFRGGQYRDLPKTYGALVALKELNGNLIAVMENGVLLIPVNERALAGEGDGGSIYINTANVLPENPRVLSNTYGSIWKDSVIQTIGVIYGIDTVAKKIWKTDGQSFEVISDLKVQKFLNDNIDLNESDKLPQIDFRNVKTHFNAFKGDVMFTFYNDDKNWNLCYNEKLGKFITFYSWIPNFSENINNIFFSFNFKDSAIKYLSNLLNEDDGIMLNEDDGFAELEIAGVNPSYLWKHGQAGNYLEDEPIKPTKWYGNVEPFEFEFVMADKAITQKIFDNLKIISNKAKPNELEFDIVGEGYDWFKVKDTIYDLNDLDLMSITDDYGTVTMTKHSLGERYLEYLTARPQVKKIPYIERIRESGEWQANSTNVKLIKDELLNEERIRTTQLANDIKVHGRLRGNIQYLEDLWNVEIRPVNFEYAYLSGGEVKFTTLKQSRLRDKYLRIRVKYSGNDLAIVQAIKTTYTISYA